MIMIMDLEHKSSNDSENPLTNPNEFFLHWMPEGCLGNTEQTKIHIKDKESPAEHHYTKTLSLSIWNLQP